MLSLQRLQRVHLRRRPWSHTLLSFLLVGPAYKLCRTRIVFEGLENIPQDRAVFLAMNHTDRYNTFPLQSHFVIHGWRTTAAWVKGKYYEHPLMACFMESTNGIPLPSKGYVLVTEYRRIMGHPPADESYRKLRDLAESEIGDKAAVAQAENDLQLAEFMSKVGGARAFQESFNGLFDAMAAECVRLTRQAIVELGIHVIVFPDGTRGKRLGKGLTGLAQVAQHLEATIVPIGCNGNDRVYPGNSPVPRPGVVTFRIGKPIEPNDPELQPFRVPPDVRPLTRGANANYATQYRQITNVIMRRINALLDPEYQLGHDTSPCIEKGVARFV